LYYDAVPIWNAFRDLSSSRSTGFSISHIPYSEITNWLDENIITSLEERKHYRYFIGFIDNIWVGHMNEKSESGNKNKSRGPTTRQQKGKKP
jgi:hypothetical protein